MLYTDAVNKRKSNWMRYLNMARKEREQNLKPYQYQGKVYYRTYKDIQPGTELLEFYGYDYGRILGIDMDEYYTDESDEYIDDELHGAVPIPEMGM